MIHKLKIEFGVMEHCIGLSNFSKVAGRCRTYKAYRNYFSCSGQSEEWELLCADGFAKSQQEKRGEKTIYWYSLTDNGFKFLEVKYGIRIKKENN